MAVDIDSLQIEISATSDTATKRLEELAATLERLRSVMGGASTATNRQTAALQQMRTTVERTNRPLNNLVRNIRRTVAAGLGFYSIGRGLKSAVKNVVDYAETVNLFGVAMGGYYDQAYRYSQLVSSKLGIDPKEWMDSQATLRSLAKGFGLTGDKAYQLSKSLTELAYDTSSLYNEDVQSSITRLQSGFVGETKAIRRLGVDISEAALKQYALAHGIDASVESMSQQEKALLRSLAIMEGVSRTGAIGDFARTLKSPANAMRVLRQQITLLSREIGNLLLPIVMSVIPWIRALVSTLSDGVRAMASFFNISMPEWDPSDWEFGSGLGDNFEDATGSIEGATDAAKKLRGQLIGIDELNILNKQEKATNTDASANIEWADNLEIPSIWDEDMLAGIKSRTDELKKQLEPLLDIVLRIAAGFAAWKIAEGLISGLSALQKLLGGLGAGLALSGLLPMLGLFGLFIDGVNQFIRGLKSFLNEGPTFDNVTDMIAGFAGAVGSALMMLGATKFGGALMLVAGLTNIVKGLKGIVDNGFNVNDVLNITRGIGQVFVGVGGLTNNKALMGAGAFLVGSVMVIEELKKNWEAIKSGDWSGVDWPTIISGAVAMVGGLGTLIGALIEFRQMQRITQAVTTLSNTSSAIAAAGGAVGAVNNSITTSLSPSLKSLAGNLGLGLAVIAEVSAAALLIVGAIALLGVELREVGEAWEPVIENGETVAGATLMGTNILIGVGLATAAIGSVGGASLAVNIGLGTAILAEVGLATGLFLVEVWAIGTGLDEIGRAWKPVLDNGENIATAIGVGTGTLVAIGVVTAALGAVTVGTSGLLPAAIGVGTAVLVELAAAFLLFVESLTKVAESLSQRLAPELDRVNASIPTLKTDMSKFTSYLRDFAGEITGYTESLGSITWNSIVGKFIGLFSDNPIQDMSDSVGKVSSGLDDLISELNGVIPKLETAINKMATYTSLLSSLKGFSNNGQAVPLSVESKSTFASRSANSYSVQDITAYASGGFPEHGQMFIAREDGPELVGQMGNRAAVANNDQIVDGIASANTGVINAVMAIGAMITKAVNDKDTTVSLDGRQVSRSLYKYNQQTQREKGSPIT